MKSEEVMVKALKILERELSSEEFLIYLQTITERTGDSVKELRDKTGNLSLDEVLKLVKEKA
ncbi:MAG: hypothetical protein H0Z19_10865 [Archaeoglobus sp.]|uniref:hypothetical protein n=1 Tax=Archaeoglobus sp. TaxID=1872626 RepID=UPI001D4DA078|nr:hypothetical protein [Archaeoglobus sp.]MBO8180953.1 hypothetical protein [Archaeoglobus sp.]